MNIMKASNEWANRPDDERFESVQALHDHVVREREISRELRTPIDKLAAVADDGAVKIRGPHGHNASLTNWSFGQLAGRVSAPAGYLRTLPAELAAENINHGIKALSECHDAELDTNLLMAVNGGLEIRALNSDRYSRIWNSDITGRLLKLQADNGNWINPIAFKRNGEIGLGTPGIGTRIDNSVNRVIPEGMEPSGLYASDRDMFCFLVDESKTIEGSPQGLNRGFFVWNSEVGASSFGIMTFLYDMVCGNHIVWNAKNVMETRIRHVGVADEKAFRGLTIELQKYSDSSVSEIEATIASAKKYELGTTKDKALDSLFAIIAKKNLTDLSKKRATEALDTAEKRTDRYGNPYTLWAAVSGLTENSQKTGFMDERVKIDRAAGKLLEVAF
ncbi:MAG: hypothetical protein A3F54_04085 [Candidatus Kerfeldbacteria bacterium RIFCSPHIGHO2_12_FULL_48_17]|uniref:DUF932 domain-containing protein n=1 Tax=Candidatus Kerfeldbacteria bacterium RIFCSPHIGHO2_12_FULL_48_17 TaxID=1798542 RepID=A0A1G2B077_9BACT|nr:MAG: hypothetical protein A3F54_04085 [Candidatus Kerfeldbacteria bacterium RIFCSPHIGHO2_12_FULL_48_17]